LPDVKFTISGEASSLLRANEQIQRSQEQVASGFARTAGAAETASTRTIAAVSKAAEAYELAEAAATTPARPRFGSSSSYRTRPYSIAPIIAPPTQMIIPAVKGTQQFELADEVRARGEAASAATWRAMEDARISAARSANIAHATFSANAWDRRLTNVDRVRGEIRDERMGIAAAEGQRLVADFERRSPLNPANVAAQAAASERAITSWSRGVSKAMDVVKYSAGATMLAVHTVASELSRLADVNVQFENEMRPLLSLGDNLQHGDSVRQNVLTTSTGYGMSRGDVAGGGFFLESAAANFKPETRAQIMQSSLQLSQLTGADLQSSIVGITKMLQTYGKELGTAEMAASKLYMTQARGAITQQELNELMPDVLAASKLMGYSFEDFAGATDTATAALGKNEKTLTGLRNLFIQMPKAMEEGLVHQGKFIDQMRELNNVDPSAMEKVFGMRTVAVVATLASHTRELAVNIDRIKQVSGDLVGSKVSMQFENPSFASAEAIKVYKQGIENADVEKIQGDPWARDQVESTKAFELGLRRNAPTWSPQWTLSGLALGRNVLSQGMGFLGASPSEIPFGSALSALSIAGVKAAADKAAAAGNKNTAAYIRLAHGEESGVTYQVPKSITEVRRDDFLRNEFGALMGSRQRVSRFKNVPTGPDDADAFAKMSVDYNLNESTFTNYLTLKGHGGDTDAFLRPLRRTDKILRDQSWAIGTLAHNFMQGPIAQPIANAIAPALAAASGPLQSAQNWLTQNAPKYFDAETKTDDRSPQEKFAAGADKFEGSVARFEKVIARLEDRPGSRNTRRDGSTDNDE
jgi:hypothetical protein